MGALLSVVKFIGPPGSIPLLLLCLLAGWALIRFRPRWRRLAETIVGVVLAAYGVLAVPTVAQAIAARLPPVHTANPRAIGPLDSIVLFDGDNRVGRAAVTADLVKTSDAARVFVLGEPWLVRRLVALGVPLSRIVLDGSTPTTRAQMAWVQANAPAHTGARTAIVVSRLQVARVVAIAQSQGQTFTVVASPIDTEPPTAGAWRFVPSYVALRVSRDAIYELAALAYYDWRGFTHGDGN